MKAVVSAGGGATRSGLGSPVIALQAVAEEGIPRCPGSAALPGDGFVIPLMAQADRPGGFRLGCWGLRHCPCAQVALCCSSGAWPGRCWQVRWLWGCQPRGGPWLCVGLAFCLFAALPPELALGGQGHGSSQCPGPAHPALCVGCAVSLGLSFGMVARAGLWLCGPPPRLRATWLLCGQWRLSVPAVGLVVLACIPALRAGPPSPAPVPAGGLDRSLHPPLSERWGMILSMCLVLIQQNMSCILFIVHKEGDSGQTR